MDPIKTSNCNNVEARLFAGVFPGGISYADRTVEQHGDYKKLAFLDFATLTLTWYAKRLPGDLVHRITTDAAAIQARKGEDFQVSTVGQVVTLGHRL